MSDQQEAVEAQTNTEALPAEDVLYDNSKEESQTEEIKEGKAPEPEVEETKEGEEDKVADKSDAEFDLKLPENTLLSDDDKAQLAEVAKEQGLSAEQAQKFLDMQDNLVSEIDGQLKESFKEQVNSWAEEIKADKEFGGENLVQNAELAKRAVKAFAGEEFLTELDESGYGNHPQLFKMLVKIGREMEAGSLVLSNAQSNQPKSMAEAFYGPGNDNNN